MTVVVTTPKTDIVYPSADGEPVAETYDHVYAILTTLEVLKQHLAGRRATVLGNQFLYYAQGFPKVRVAPDVMVIFDVESGGRDNYKIWEEGQVPKAIFEMTSPGTKSEDQNHKKDLYESLEVQEYWLFDPKGEWITEKLRGYRLGEEGYQLIRDNRSEVLQLRLEIEGELIGFYREDNGEKLLIPDELASALTAEKQRADELESLLARYREEFGELS
ncbi:Uma2 family endonuclease [Limnofasciculus baicalensis]|uniref:Uma2 family endonuclease n=1 Tax=Limnofasciculus baicalensis BBK-W-15 TaxID=2699891 RepID=A0AAE3KNH7_9CYAN|nr:Uma2 family endonuclease [Limnofasciculus baicalensis]MCP2728668.1 Uma2 family endonuclease [Limnofasciculus baicalensis BBK-W-15]